MNHVTSPDNSDRGVEQAIQAAGLTGPRVTPQDIRDAIVSEYFFTAADAVSYNAGGPTVAPEESLKLLTFCVLVLRNGFTVTGKSACAAPENFDAEIGRRIARGDAVNQIWPLMGYALKDRLWRDSEDAIQFANATGIPPYQQRVIDEKAKLDSDLDKLIAFLSTESFAGLDKVNQELLHAQVAAMTDYSNVLIERVALFNQGTT